VAHRTASSLSKALTGEIIRLSRLDDQNRSRFGWPTSTGGARSIARAQLCVLTEGVFLASFRAYEVFLEELFLLFCCGGNTASGRIVVSYLNPKNRLHARDLMQSSMRFLEWNNPDDVVRRAENYLRRGFPIKVPITLRYGVLHDARRIRNHIAHGSQESKQQYLSTLRNHLTVVPTNLPRPGEFLLMPSRSTPTIHNLRFFLDLFSDLARRLAH